MARNKAREEVSHYPASKEFMSWAGSLSGLLTTIKTKYGGIVEMVESPEWDESETIYAAQLLRSLKVHITKVERELTCHENQKTKV